MLHDAPVGPAAAGQGHDDGSPQPNGARGWLGERTQKHGVILEVDARMSGVLAARQVPRDHAPQCKAKEAHRIRRAEGPRNVDHHGGVQLDL
eukprot:2087991-Pyramimonas_sp.AAC.1